MQSRAIPRVRHERCDRNCARAMRSIDRRFAKMAFARMEWSRGREEVAGDERRGERERRSSATSKRSAWVMTVDAAIEDRESIASASSRCGSSGERVVPLGERPTRSWVCASPRSSDLGRSTVPVDARRRPLVRRAVPSSIHLGKIDAFLACVACGRRSPESAASRSRSGQRRTLVFRRPCVEMSFIRASSR